MATKKTKSNKQKKVEAKEGTKKTEVAAPAQAVAKVNQPETAAPAGTVGQEELATTATAAPAAPAATATTQATATPVQAVGQSPAQAKAPASPSAGAKPAPPTTTTQTAPAATSLGQAQQGIDLPETQTEVTETEPKKVKKIGFGLFPKRVGRDDVPLEQRNRAIYMMALMLTGVVLGATGMFFYLRLKQKPVTDEGVVEVVQTEEVEAEPGIVQLKRGEVSLDVMNGSGVAGAAGRVAATFEDLGYMIYEIGNADSTDGNKLYINPDLEERLEVLLEDVKEELDIASVSGELDGDESTASARIILGK